MRSLRYAWRQLRRTPAFTLAAVVSLALGIGANTAMFTLADALLFRPLPVPEPRRLVRVQSVDASGQARGVVTTMVDAIRDARVFDDVCGLLPLGVPSTIDIDGRVLHVSALAMSGQCFTTLGIKPALGRLFATDDDVDGAQTVMAISHDSWMQDFGGRPDVLGRTIRMEGRPFTIVGVVERGFQGVEVGFPVRVFFPLHTLTLPAGLPIASLTQVVFARLRAGDTAAGAETRLAVEWPAWLAVSIPSRMAESNRERYLERRPMIVSAATGIGGALRLRFGKPLTALLAVAGLVLMVAAVNVANLWLARAVGRRRETAVRLALGATRWQIARGVLTESLLVLSAAATASVLVAYWCDRFLVATFRATSANFELDVSPDSRALAFTCGAAAVALLVFALGPALNAADVDVAAFSAASARTTGDRSRARRAILVAQVALTLVLVAVGSVFVDALASLRRAPLGFDAEQVLNVQLAPLPGGYPNGFGPAPYYRSLLERLQAIPGIESVALAHFDPFSTPPLFEDTGAVGSDAPAVSVEEAIVTDGFFQTMKIPLIAGDDFRRSDEAARGRTVIVSESLARRLFGVDPPIGRLIKVGTKSDLQAIRVIGVAGDAVLSRPQTRNTVVAYHNFWQAPEFFPTLVIRTRVDPIVMAASVRDVLRREGREYPIQIHTMSESLDASLSQERLLASLSASFGVLGLVLAAVGVYGLIAFTVASRTIEIGVRMALGASRTSVLRLVVGDACRLLTLGIAIGVPLAWAAARAASRLLVGGGPSPVLPIGSAVLLLVCIGVAAATIPARRASSVDPMQALRHD